MKLQLHIPLAPTSRNNTNYLILTPTNGKQSLFHQRIDLEQNHPQQTASAGPTCMSSNVNLTLTSNHTPIKKSLINKIIPSSSSNPPIFFNETILQFLKHNPDPMDQTGSIQGPNNIAYETNNCTSSPQSVHYQKIQSSTIIADSPSTSQTPSMSHFHMAKQPDIDANTSTCNS